MTPEEREYRWAIWGELRTLGWDSEAAELEADRRILELRRMKRPYHRAGAR